MSQFSRSVRMGALVAMLLILTGGLVQGAPLGTLKIGGEAEVTQTTIDFSTFLPGPPLNGMGSVVAIGAGSGVFAPLVFGNFGTIVDRSVDAGIVPAQPAGDPTLSVPNWITFANPAFRYALDLKYINVGTFSAADCFSAPANGQTCTPDAPFPFQSPYNLSNFVDSNAGLSSNANFSVRGVLRNLDTGTADYIFNGVFGAEFLGQSYQQVLAAVSAPNGSVVASYSATLDITAVIPEPSTGGLAAIGVGLAMFGGFFRRRRKQ